MSFAPDLFPLIRLRWQLDGQTIVGVLVDLKKDVCRTAGREENGKCDGVGEGKDDRLCTVGLTRRSVTGAGVGEGELRSERRGKIALFVSDQSQIERYAVGDSAHAHLDVEREL